ncbi:type II toxin-antitoxin system PemK/MazF family toxin [Deinococcus sp. QL22]|uniref:type II toxin-antitoxin system PemK/MazF family toxin n=1 Tax=Deinococcus sp. QL22 TaxID=2939437 RepID=UPI002018096F|nr:type II toxin-antitoxin system PemK/MazF family toxin [Deinococcus sp. QL22]UQN08752.1 type II toxin-antitoxin system PemK/MazF family toxin [Deinococcus sp. QL22]
MGRVALFTPLNPARSSEANTRRPAAMVSADSLNRTVNRLGGGAIIAVPLTSNVSRVFDFQVLLPAAETGLEEDSKAQAEQIRMVSFSRLGREPLGHLPAALMQKLDAALRLHLAL